MYKFPFEKKNISEDKVVIITKENIKITYGELLRKVTYVGTFITARSVCLVKTSNSLEGLIIYLACLQKKSVAILLDNNTKENSFQEIINSFKPNYIFNNLENIENDNYKKYNNEVISSFFIQKKFKKLNIKSNIAILISTSGSTGSVKFAKISYKNLRSNTINIIDYLKISQSDRTITNLPLFYSYGLSIVNTHIFAGASLILTDKALIDKSSINLVKENKITNLNGVPFTYDIIFKFNLDKYYLSNINFLTHVGGKLKLEAFDKIINILKNKKKFYIMYGQTEASPRMSYCLVKNKTFINGLIGKPIKGGQFFLLDKENKIISKPNTIGKLFYKGPNVFLGYASNILEMNSNKSTVRLLDTGDMAKFNFNNQFILVSRDSRYIKIEDKRINLDDIEYKLQQSDLEVLCTGNDHIFIWYTEKGIEKNKIYQIIKENFSITKRVITLKHINEFPKNSAGKILYKNLLLK